jgi:serine protease inhibitor
VGSVDTGPAPGGGGLRLISAAGVERVVPPAGTSLAPTVDGMTRFGYALMGVASTRTGNFVCSPASIAYAFGMARAGARGETAAQIDEVLGFPTGTDGPHLALNSVARQAVTVDAAPVPAPGATRPARKAGEKPGPPVVAIANGQFVQVGFELEEAFLRILAQHYGAGVQSVDFGSSQAKALIDAWVREQTAGRIAGLFDQISPDTRLVLANAVYLKADWASPFVKYPVEPAAFTRTDGRVVQVPTMQDHRRARYATSARWQAVELPYAGDELAMLVLVPLGEVQPVSLLAPAVLSEVVGSLRQGSVAFAMPRWDFATRMDLMAPLAELGMRAPFGAADFSGISASGLSIGQAVHLANITVDEWGTEAAAVTGIAFPVSGPPPPDLSIRADRPFAFAIMHRPTKAPLFIGQVVDPAPE